MLIENIEKSGERVWIEWHNKAPAFDKDGNRTGHIAIGADITERLKAEEALKRKRRKLMSVLNATQESVYMFDREWSIYNFKCYRYTKTIQSERKRTVRGIISRGVYEALYIARERHEKLEQVFVTGKPLNSKMKGVAWMFHPQLFPGLQE